LHPVWTLLTVGVVGSVAGIGLHLWFEPAKSAIAIVIGAIAGAAVAYAFGGGALAGLVVGSGLALLAIGVRALVSIMSTLDRPPSASSPRVWFAR
jgi:hypothetical protein